MIESYIQINHLKKSFLEGRKVRPVLDDLSISFNKGEFVVILGKSGSGKSTLLNLLSGIDRPDAGEIWINGENISRMDERNRTLFRRREVGFIFQFFNLLPTLTVGENTTLPLELNGFTPSEAAARAQAILAQVGLENRWDTFPDRLSGGEQQRVAIARALVHDPGIILADEPTGNLDADTGEQVLHLLDRLTRKSEKTMIMVTHSLEAASYADRTYFLREGSLEPIEKQVPVAP
jgi:putative ABC transport system ATP-binding protein